MSGGLRLTLGHVSHAWRDLRVLEDKAEDAVNVMRQVKNVAADVFVQDAWARGQELHVHGWVYALGNGLITDLNVTVGGP